MAREAAVSSQRRTGKPCAVALPRGVVTVTGPVSAPDGTVTVMRVEVFEVTVAGLPLTVTTVAPVKRFPKIVMFPDA